MDYSLLHRKKRRIIINFEESFRLFLRFRTLDYTHDDDDCAARTEKKRFDRLWDPFDEKRAERERNWINQRLMKHKHQSSPAFKHVTEVALFRDARFAERKNTPPQFFGQ